MKNESAKMMYNS